MAVIGCNRMQLIDVLAQCAPQCVPLREMAYEMSLWLKKYMGWKSWWRKMAELRHRRKEAARALRYTRLAVTSQSEASNIYTLFRMKCDLLSATGIDSLMRYNPMCG